MSLDALLDKHGSRAVTKRDASSMAFLTPRERATLKRKQINSYEAPDDDEEEEKEEEGVDAKKPDVVASDSDVEEDGEESDAEDLEKNRKERKKAKGARDAEMVASARLRKQGIIVDEETGEEQQGYASWKKGQTEKPKTEKEMEKSEHQAKMRSLFDKRAGEQYESFNMNADKDQPASKNDDAWLDEVDERDKRQAALDAASSAHAAKSRQPKPEGGIADSDDDEDMDIKSTPKNEVKEIDPIDARYELLKYMKPGETVLKAVKRLGEERTSSSAAVTAAHATLKKKNIRAKDREAAEATIAADKAKSGDNIDDSERKKAFDAITDAAQALLNVGFIEIYGETYEKIQYFLRQHESQKSNPSTSTSKPTSHLTWEYKWSTDDDNKHGPFPGKKMNEYRHAGYFQKDVVVRRMGTAQWISASLVPDFNSTEVISSSTSALTSTPSTSSSSSQPPKKKFKF